MINRTLLISLDIEIECQKYHWLLKYVAYGYIFKNL